MFAVRFVICVQHVPQVGRDTLGCRVCRDIILGGVFQIISVGERVMLAKICSLYTFLTGRAAWGKVELNVYIHQDLDR